MFFFFNDTATTQIYTYRHTLSLHDALPIYELRSHQHEECGGVEKGEDEEQHRVHGVPRRDHHESRRHGNRREDVEGYGGNDHLDPLRSEEHTSELQSLMRISYAVFCLKKTKQKLTQQNQA